MSLAADSIEIVRANDPDVASAIDAEVTRQHSTLEMIASENFASKAVMQAAGTVFTNKYAEGYPGRRYYHGCDPSDAVETLARDRAKELFGADHANVQPHSGTTANQEVYFASIKTGDTILSMSLAHGGHLSHGHKVNAVGSFYNIANYGVTQDTELIDYDDVAAKAREHNPAMIVAGGSAYPSLIDFAKFREIADEVGALLLVDMAHFAGLVAGKAIPSPVPYADFTSTTTHKTLRGPRSGLVLCKEQYAKALDKSVFPGMQGGPLMHIIAAKAVAFGEALKPSFQDYAKQVIANAKALGDALVSRGLRLVSGGTETHLVLVDLTNYGVTGKAAADTLEHAGITVNMNMIPFDTRKAVETSGIRIGTPALTSRGMKEAEMTTIANWIADVLSDIENQELITKTRKQVEELTANYPLRADEA